ncbi:MAG: response regulator [bacterium]
MKPEEITILTVDDNPSNIRLLTHYMEKEGYNVITAEDGFEGFKAAIQYHPDLILLDVMMPGTDGYEVCELLKTEEETRDIPVVFLTAKAEAEDKIKGFEMGAVDYIIKPFNLIEVSTRVKHHLKLTIYSKQNKILKDNFFNFLTEFGPSIGSEVIYKYNFKYLDSLEKHIKKIYDLKDVPDGLKKKITDNFKQITDIKSFTEKIAKYSEEQNSREIIFLPELIKNIIHILSLEIYEFVNIKLKVDNAKLSINGRKEIISLSLINLLYNIAMAYNDDVDINISLSSKSLPENLKENVNGEIKEKYARVNINCNNVWDDKEEILRNTNFFIETKIEKNIGFILSATDMLIRDIGGVTNFLIDDNFNASLYFPFE